MVFEAIVSHNAEDDVEVLIRYVEKSDGRRIKQMPCVIIPTSGYDHARAIVFAINHSDAAKSINDMRI